MNKKLVIISVLVIIFVIFILTSVFIFIIQPKTVKTPGKSLINNKQTPTSSIKYLASFQVISGNPQELKFTIDNPPEKGITSIQIYLKFNPNLKSQLKISDITETLPKPWQYVRKELTNDNEILIQAIYLQPGVNGDISKEFSFAKINLPSASESLDISLDFAKSKLFAKESGLEISFSNKLYSK